VMFLRMAKRGWKQSDCVSMARKGRRKDQKRPAQCIKTKHVGQHVKVVSYSHRLTRPNIMYCSWSRIVLPSNAFVTLWVGVPALAAQHIPPEHTSFYRSEAVCVGK